MTTLQFLLRQIEEQIFNSSFVLWFDSIPDAAGLYSLSVAFVQQRKCFCSDLPLETCFIVSSYLRSSPTCRLNRNSASGPNTTSYWPPSSGPEVVLLCTYTRIHLLVPIRVNSFLGFFFINSYATASTLFTSASWWFHYFVSWSS